MRIKQLALFLLFSTILPAFAQTPEVGRKAASKYFEKDVEPDTRTARNTAGGGGGQLLMLHLGTYMGSVAYDWKVDGKQKNIGKSNYGITYLFDEWGGMDTNLRLDFTEYKIGDERPIKLSILPLWTFPRADSRFPFYFGFGAGLGVFFKQVEDESNLSLDYQLVTGLRLMDLADTNAGFFVEFGLKNHLHILSDGQFNGTFASAGAVWSF